LQHRIGGNLKKEKKGAFREIGSDLKGTKLPKRGSGARLKRYKEKTQKERGRGKKKVIDKGSPDDWQTSRRSDLQGTVD